MPAHFTPESLKFLRGLARNNDRAWFDPRKPIYEREIKAPMLALIEAVNHALADFAPAHIRDPRKSMLRIYRDTRFAADKRPYKNKAAAWWAPQGFVKTTGAGFYFHVTAKETVIAAGAYMLPPDQLLGLRRHIVANHAELRTLLASKKLRALMPDLEPPTQKRLPRGFAPSSPAADLLLHTRWAVSTTLSPELATVPTLIKEITTRFRLAAPLIHFLNAGIPPTRNPSTPFIP
ncbi:MAG TPA: DUF2461 domain-containing protein [Acidobacteriaceae bacterium]|nr:DUF2461 domain-containing protein [Acidobacteriaceae bacterium]